MYLSAGSHQTQYRSQKRGLVIPIEKKCCRENNLCLYCSSQDTEPLNPPTRRRAQPRLQLLLQIIKGLHSRPLSLTLLLYQQFLPSGPPQPQPIFCMRQQTRMLISQQLVDKFKPQDATWRCYFSFVFLFIIL